MPILIEKKLINFTLMAIGTLLPKDLVMVINYLNYRYLSNNELDSEGNRNRLDGESFELTDRR